MKIKFYIIIALVLLIIIGGVFLFRLIIFAFDSRKHGQFPRTPSFGDLATGEIGYDLQACPSTPNCYFTTLERGGKDLKTIKNEVVAMGGEIRESRDNYFYATFQTRWFGYIDDLEVLLKDEVIQIRSASRVGYSDLGKNRRRVEALLKRL